MWINDKSPGIQCGFCSKVFHGKCVSLNKEQLTFFGSNIGATYRCADCRGSNGNVNKGDCENCGVLLSAIKELQLAIETLKNEVKALKKESASPGTAVEDIISEVTERQYREKNIIMHGMNPQNTADADRYNALQILRQIVPNLSEEGIKVRRLGSGKNGKPAPLRIQLCSREDVFVVLKNKKKLQEINVQINITTDNTPLQRDQLRRTLQQISERKKNGEEGLYIRYVRGNPTIAKSKNQV